jgi:hypothetical protein
MLRRRERKQRNRRIRAGAVGIIVALAAASVLVRWLKTDVVPANPVPSGQQLQLTATIGGTIKVSSPRDWSLVDHWATTDSEIHPPTAEPLVLFEVANFDPGLGDPVCPAEPGGSRGFPAGGIAISVTVGPASDPTVRCAGAIEDVRTGTISDLGIPFTGVVVAGPDATDRDRATAAAILDSLRPTGTFAFYRNGSGHAAYVLDGWSDHATTATLVARPADGKVALSVRDIKGQDLLDGGSIEVSGSQPIETPHGAETFGAVTDDVARVELHRAGITDPLVAERIKLPPSLHARFDAFVFEPQPEGGPYEVVAFGTDGKVLYSSLPPVTHTERVGTVRAFGTTWAVKLSTAAGMHWGSCVEPAATSTLDPCRPGWGGGMLVQTFEKPVPAVFVTQFQGVVAIDVVTDDGRRYPAMMVPTRGGATVAVVPLEGAGEGRFVYQMAGGEVDQGRRPSSQVEWSDVGQVIGQVGIIG